MNENITDLLAYDGIFYKYAIHFRELYDGIRLLYDGIIFDNKVCYIRFVITNRVRPKHKKVKGPNNLYK